MPSIAQFASNSLSLGCLKRIEFMICLNTVYCVAAQTCTRRVCDIVMSHLRSVATGIAFFPDFLRP